MPMLSSGERFFFKKYALRISVRFVRRRGFSLVLVFGISVAGFVAAFILFSSDKGPDFMTIPLSLLVVGLFWFLCIVFLVVYK